MVRYHQQLRNEILWGDVLSHRLTDVVVLFKTCKFSVLVTGNSCGLPLHTNKLGTSYMLDLVSLMIAH